MATLPCPKCGHDLEADAGSCPACGHTVNGVVPPAAGSIKRPPPPPGFPACEPVPPELLEQARREFNEEEYLAALREVEETGGFEFEDIIRGLEEEAEPRE